MGERIKNKGSIRVGAVKWAILPTLALLFISISPSRAGGGPMTLADIAAVALRNNPKLKAAEQDVNVEGESVGIAGGELMPRLDAVAAATRSRYASPLTPIYEKPGPTFSFPDFANPVYDAALSFSVPLYRGGRLVRNVEVARLRQSAAVDALSSTREDLLFNLASLYYKILQLEIMKASAEAVVEQMEAHHKDILSFYEAGSASRLDTLKSEVELARVRHNIHAIDNSIESAMEALKALMGLDDASASLELAKEPKERFPHPPVDESLATAYSRRSEISAAKTRVKISEERILIAEGKKLPVVTLTADYGGRAGDDARMNENWNASLKMSVPVFEGGTTAHETAKARNELEKAREEERAIRLAVTREVKDARLSADLAEKRIETLAPAVTAAREALRVERLRFSSGAGSSTDVTDAAVSLLRTENDQSQAVYDKALSLASLARAMGTLSNSLEVER